MTMKITVLILSLIGFMPAVMAAEVSGSITTEVFRIEMGKNYKDYSQGDLQRRVWELERAVWQLQQRVFELQSTASAPLETWVCTVKAMGNVYTGTGETNALATANAIESCKAARGGDGFFCKNPKCNQ